MERQPVRSGNVRSVGYDSAARILHVEFNAKDARMPGRVYEYKGVAPEQHQALITAQSVGAHFAQHIKSRFRGRIVYSPSSVVSQNADAVSTEVDVACPS